jgi:hypothetical protein
MHKRRNVGAFLLLDALIAIFMGAIVLLSVVNLVIAGAVASESARQNNLAVNGARQILENVRLRRNAVLTDGTYSDATVFGPVPQIASLRNGSASVKISTVQSTLKSVVISVTWRSGERGGQTKTRVISGLLGPRGASL